MSFSYQKSGVDYNLLDPIKKKAQVAGKNTAKNLLGTEFTEISASRGESAYVIESKDCYFAFVEEGLGSKNLIADEMGKITGKTYYDLIAYDTVLSIVMDLTTVGARPLTVLSYWAVGESKWLADRKRMVDFITGWKRACDLVGATWGGGETPTLKDIINPETIDLAGAAWGIIKPKDRLVLGDSLQDGDIIILFASSGIHVNGLTLARKLALQIPKGYTVKLSNGRTYGEELLTPTQYYGKIIEDLQKLNIDIHYMANITGHGWRKLMRAKKDLSYVINDIGQVPEIFKFIRQKSGLPDREMYATFNMGAGFAVYVGPNDVDKVSEIAKTHKIQAWIGGKVISGEKKVIIKPLNITFREKDLNIR